MKEFLSEKYQNLQKNLIDMIAKKAKSEAQTIFNSFQQMELKLKEAPKDIEKLTDQKIGFDKFEGFQATAPIKEEVRKQEPRTEKPQNNQTRLLPRSERARQEQPKREGNPENQKRFRPKWPKNR